MEPASHRTRIHPDESENAAFRAVDDSRGDVISEETQAALEEGKRTGKGAGSSPRGIRVRYAETGPDGSWVYHSNYAHPGSRSAGWN